MAITNTPDNMHKGLPKHVLKLHTMHKPDLISNIQLAGSLYATSTDEMEKQS
jgi:hypothetical protein